MDRFRIISKIGAGGFGEVFRAWDLQRDVPVVLKRPLATHLRRSDILERFDREITRLSELVHSHIVPIVDKGRGDDGLPYLAMRFLPAGSLADRNKPQPISFLHRWLPHVAQALDYVHARGIVHRDVKPANIFFDTQSTAYLGDFGIAKIIDEDLAMEAEHSLTSTGGEIGTYPYMGPEFFRKPRRLSGAYDQYALAITVYEMVSGRRPFTGDSGQLILAHATQEPPDIRSFRSDAPVSLSRAVAKALSKQPDHRFESCSAFAEAVLVGIAASVVDDRYHRFLCPSCRKLIRVPSLFGGRSCRCPACNAVLHVSNNFDALWHQDEVGTIADRENMGWASPLDRHWETRAEQSRSQVIKNVILVPAFDTSKMLTELIPESLARRHTIFPMSQSANVLQVAACEPDHQEFSEEVRFASGLEVEVFVVPYKVIAETIDSFYSEDLPVCQLINLIVLEAIELNASAVHVMPYDDGVGIQYEIDGELVDRDVMPRRLLGAVIYRIKTLFGLDNAVKEHLQEGEALAILAGGEQRELNARVIATTSGPSAILRIAIPRPSAKS